MKDSSESLKISKSAATWKADGKLFRMIVCKAGSGSILSVCRELQIKTNSFVRKKAKSLGARVGLA